MFERLRFTRYALKFERAFRDDNWAPVKACFQPDATYAITGTGTDYDGVARGADAIVATFKRMLDELDRKFDRRIPRLAGLPRVRGGELTLPWKVRYVKGDRSIWLSGTSRCRFAGGKISELSDAMDAVEVERWAALVA